MSVGVKIVSHTTRNTSLLASYARSMPKISGPDPILEIGDNHGQYMAHLHFELRTGETYLGAGLTPEGTRVLYRQLFEPFP